MLCHPSKVSQPVRRSHCLVLISIIITQIILVRQQASKIRTYYVSPSSIAMDGWCSTYNHDSCFNLTEVATSLIMERAAVNISLILVPGNHTLLSNLTIAECAYFLLKSEDSLRPAVINCGESSRLQILFSTNVHIRGITLNGCVNNEVKTVERLTIEDSTLSARGLVDSVSGHALVISNSTVAIMGSTLKYFTITKPMSFQPSSRGYGGAILSEHSYVLITNSVFFMNSAYNDVLFREHYSNKQQYIHKKHCSCARWSTVHKMG